MSYPLSVPQLTPISKYIYASEILALIPMACAKLSVVSLVMRIPGDRSMRRPCQAASIIILLWTIFSLFAISFQCGAVHPWVYTPQNCAGGLWYPVIILNMLTDALHAFFFTPVLWKLQTSRAMRLRVICLFGVRIVYVLSTWLSIYWITD